MLATIAKKVFGTKNDRELKRMGRLVEVINGLGESLSQLSDSELQNKTVELKQAYQGGKTLDELLPEAFAVVREASTRVMGMRHFDVQMLGGMSLHEGRIAEMRTGEGKTLTATLPAYLNALSGEGVHVVTVNDYLAERDANWMRPLYEFLGLTVGVILSQQPAEMKREAYNADITYGTNNEFGFDYLRDNMAFRLDDRVQRGLNYAIVDEVDSILIDEARTPLIISGPAADSSELYQAVNKLMPQLQPQPKDEEGGHYFVDEKQRQVELTEEGHQLIESLLVSNGLLEEGESLYAAHNLALLHHVHAALKAHALFHKDRDYIVQGGQIVIVDEHTGRTMPGRRWSEGIHQAVEAKEGVNIQQENQTLASTTFQNYFRLYNKLAGMTGTADTEAAEFRQIYGMDVVVVPTNRPMVRVDANDQVYLSLQEKFDAIAGEIKGIVEKGAPVLVGTATIEASEYLSQRLKKDKIPHEVLNAKFHEREAQIIAQAGRPGAVTIATNMAGRGTDIMLGGNPEEQIKHMDNPSEGEAEKIRAEWQANHDQVLEAGGLHIIGTERHESRRIDNQLRGRAGRQGDPGYTRFFLSMEDDLMRIFASDKIRNLMRSLGLENGEAIEHRWVTRAIENAQRKVEGRNFDIRKNLLEYDDVANDQRRVIYSQRDQILEAESLASSIASIREDVVEELVHNYMQPGTVEDQWDVPGLEKTLDAEFQCKAPVGQWLNENSQMHIQDVVEKLSESLAQQYQEKEAQIGEDTLRQIEKHLMLQILDRHWKEHLASMDHLRQGIHLRGYAQKNPKQEYKKEAFTLFQEMLNQIQHELIRILHSFEMRRDDEVERLERQRQEEARIQAEKMKMQAAPEPGTDGTAEQGEAPKTVVREGRKIGRNEPCPCGSGKKYKQCHGKLES
ncbi:preprotein translocase subunit SecA [Alcanivorax hongdengensis A-11-3]|uniref:Protein translocase subunit SecA n=1 Tax=Alcanivorax hongdengensis A-11-3 TaxID=1177179 RepID=L0WEM0_9GAMM|nr:preprotein translocase subunit SecA [Alcanivorax hongdengensis]EKF74255.1 preprotein translocase subunit SecA [Alcanivorax hongdengensis A-11-3]